MQEIAKDIGMSTADAEAKRKAAHDFFDRKDRQRGHRA